MANLEARTENPAYFMGMNRLQGIVVRELRDLLAEMNLGGGGKRHLFVADCDRALS